MEHIIWLGDKCLIWSLGFLFLAPSWGALQKEGCMAVGASICREEKGVVAHFTLLPANMLIGPQAGGVMKWEGM